VLFRPLDRFIAPHVVFEKSQFFGKKWVFTPDGQKAGKMRFVGKKTDFSQKRHDDCGAIKRSNLEVEEHP